MQPQGTVCAPASCDAAGQIATSAAICDDQGKCGQAERATCGPGAVCAEGACLPEEAPLKPEGPLLEPEGSPVERTGGCSQSTDCDGEPGAYCLEGTCVTGQHCATAEDAAYDARGRKTECAPMRCAAGACLTSCVATKADCAEGYWCDPESHQCRDESAFAAVQSPAAIECGLRGNGGHARSHWLIVLALTWRLRQRRLARLKRHPNCSLHNEEA